MQRRHLGSLEVSAVGLGCLTLTAAYGAPPPEADAIAIIHRARDLGIDLLDTSDAYAKGENEILVGKAIAGRRGDFVVASKFGNLRRADGTPTADGRPAYVRQACEASLRRLNTDTIDLYYIHRVDPTVPIEDTVGAMAALVRAGKVRCLGISEAAPATIRRAHAVHPMSAVQIEYSLWTRDVEAEVLGLCRELGIGFVAYSPLGRGFLAGAVTMEPPPGDMRHGMPRFTGDNLRRNLALLAEFRAIATTADCSPAQLALAWLLSRQPPVVPIVSSSRRERLEANAAAAQLAISRAILASAEHLFAPGSVAGPRYGATATRVVGL
ncbi:MAG TPA: aldo/keto reductase [Acetobacteraceae bacterium]|nr:aldo/keto reductase [Acetobacteraceae bacterium]